MGTHILKRPEPASDMVEHTVKDDPNAVFMQGTTDLCKVLIGSQPAVDLTVIPGIVTVRITFKQR